MSNYTPYSSFEQNNSGLPKIVVIGMGGGGSNAVNRMIEDQMRGGHIRLCQHGRPGTRQ